MGVDPPKQLVAERRDLEKWVKNGIHHGGHNLHKGDKVRKELEGLNKVDVEKTKERVVLETENYEKNKEKDHGDKWEKRQLHFDEIDEAREQRVEKVKKERKAMKKAAQAIEDGEEGQND